jgi:hypothetical protein
MNEPKKCPQCGVGMSWGRNTGFICVANHDKMNEQKPVDLDVLIEQLLDDDQDFPGPNVLVKALRELKEARVICNEVEALRERVVALQAANEMLMADASKALVRALVHNDTARNQTKGTEQA